MKKILLSSLGLLSLAMANAQSTQTFTYGWAAPNPQVYVVPSCVGQLEIVARGASGCDQGASFSAGKGAHVQGKFDVNPGDTILIRVGQNPCTGFANPSLNGGTGGGGGSYVVKRMNGVYTPLAIAGGGGGGGNAENTMKHGQASSTAGNGIGGSNGSAGTSGNGGGTSGYSGSGGGYYTDGGGYYANLGGKAFLNGSDGGTSNLYRGGFGGGGAGIGSYSGGGGGGYNGGGAGGSDGCGGGGGSYNAGYATNDSTGVNTGHGIVKITAIKADPNFSISFTTEDAKCKGGDGKLFLTVSGAFEPIKYDIDGWGFMDLSTLSNRSFGAGEHYLVLKDACQNISDTTFFDIFEPSTYVGIDEIVVPGGDSNTGSIEVTGTGGVPPYLYNIDGSTWDTQYMWDSLANGTYIVGVKDANDCDAYKYITLEGYASLDNTEFNDIQVYPNPATSILSIKNDKNIRYDLLDMTGKLIMNSTTFALSHTLSTEHIESGIYLLNLYTENNAVKTVKVVIK
ncbi:MAG TPA: T9SS type A sorting domain-containing protein [Bacteroidia bacterium]